MWLTELQSKNISLRKLCHSSASWYGALIHMRSFRYILLGNSLRHSSFRPLNPPIIQNVLQRLQANLFLIPPRFYLKSFHPILLFSSIIHLSFLHFNISQCHFETKWNKENKFRQYWFMSLWHKIQLLSNSMSLFSQLNESKVNSNIDLIIA